MDKKSIIETPAFTKQVSRLLDKTQYNNFLQYLKNNPLKGKVIKHTNGLRKIRWNKKNTGKRGGVRIIYYIESETTIYLLEAYDKKHDSDISRKQAKKLSRLVNDLKNMQ